ncbi:MAG: sporulation protein YtfJ [Oscillospiraceae bacterium]|jgi:sporulation protein YtfJ|nr:sporulation protein YtfJ [Oscillospiraceae bacterium]
MEKSYLGEVMNISMTKIKEMVDVNTVIGDPVFTPDGITLIPVSQVSLGLATGGGEGGLKNGNNGMGAGVGSGVKMYPLGFLVVKDGLVRFVSTKAPADTFLDRALDMIPEVFDRVENLINNVKNKQPDEA